MASKAFLTLVLAALLLDVTNCAPLIKRVKHRFSPDKVTWSLPARSLQLKKTFDVKFRLSHDFCYGVACGDANGKGKLAFKAACDPDIAVAFEPAEHVIHRSRESQTFRFSETITLKTAIKDANARPFCKVFPVLDGKVLRKDAHIIRIRPHVPLVQPQRPKPKSSPPSPKRRPH